MGKGRSRVMIPVEEVDLTKVKYKNELIHAPHVTGFWLKLFVKMIDTPVLGSLIVYAIKNQNMIPEMLQYTDIPEGPMFKPEFPPQVPEPCVVYVDEDGKPEDRVELALKCLTHYNPANCWGGDSASQFRYWKIRDYAYAYRSRIATPSMVAERIISIMEFFDSKEPLCPLLISFNADDLKKQASASTQRFLEGNPLSVLDGIFMAIKDDIDCYPHPSKGATTWYHEFRGVKKDAACVSKLRSCGVIFVGKANMHELGMGTTGNNSNYGTARNPHDPDRYTGGSSSGPAAIVASGICSAALGTDGGGSIRIPSSLCGVVGLKTTHARTDMTGSMCNGGTVAIIGPIASSVEDVMLVYSAILGSSPADKDYLKPSLPCLPDLLSHESLNTLGSLRLGKYTKWFNDVYSTDISDTCNDALNLVAKAHGCEIVEIVIPELHEMRNAHLVSIGCESLNSLTPFFVEGKYAELTYGVRTNMAFFQTFTGSDYVAAQCLRRRLMYYHMEIFKKVDVIVTPTTGMTAPLIPLDALKYGESNLQVEGYLMRFILAGNLLGLPAISIPVGYDKQGLPIGLQLIGRPWGEASILRLASKIEEICGKPKKQPALYYDVLRGNLRAHI